VKKIFVIDDEKALQEILQVNLTKEGYEVKVFSSAEEALKTMDKDIPELILLDIMMQGMDGYDFCKKYGLCRNINRSLLFFFQPSPKSLTKYSALSLAAMIT
jgi:DNA-binding response OmpR family regulator